MHIQPQELLIPAHAAKLIGISRQAVHGLLNRGAIRSVWVAGRRHITREDAINYKEKKKQRKNAKD